jgi:hypothetical protein
MRAVTIDLSKVIQTYPELFHNDFLEDDLKNYQKLDGETIDKVFSSFDWKRYKKDLSEFLDNTCFELEEFKEFLKNEGLKNIHFSFYAPNCYNYTSDSIEISFQISEKTWKKLNKKYKKQIECYYREVKQKSYDGYISLEPGSPDDDDYNFNNDRAFYGLLYALKKDFGIDEDEIVYDYIDWDTENFYNYYEV